MKTTDIQTLIRLGFEPARYFKRSAWVKVERVMEFLVNKGEIVRQNGDVKYRSHKGGYNEEDLDRWSRLYMKSPFIQSMDAIKRLSSETGLPLNSKELLNTYMNLNTK